MTEALFPRGQLHAPYFIFIRCDGAYSDADLLGRFGLSSYRTTKALQWVNRYAVLADAGPWKMIADDWWYTIWSMSSTRAVLGEIGQKFEVFACSVGESDQSFDFEYYRSSKLVRRYVVEDPDYRGGTVVEDFGEPLPGEAVALRESDQITIVLRIAASLGIDVKLAPADVRAYGPA